MFKWIKSLFKKKEIEPPEPSLITKAIRVDHPDDPNISYVEIVDNLRLIFEEGKCIGFYIA